MKLLKIVEMNVSQSFLIIIWSIFVLCSFRRVSQFSANFIISLSSLLPAIEGIPLKVGLYFFIMVFCAITLIVFVFQKTLKSQVMVLFLNVILLTVIIFIVQLIIETIDNAQINGALFVYKNWTIEEQLNLYITILGENWEEMGISFIPCTDVETFKEGLLASLNEELCLIERDLQTRWNNFLFYYDKVQKECFISYTLRPHNWKFSMLSFLIDWFQGFLVESAAHYKETEVYFEMLKKSLIKVEQMFEKTDQYKMELETNPIKFLTKAVVLKIQNMVE